MAYWQYEFRRLLSGNHTGNGSDKKPAGAKKSVSASPVAWRHREARYLA
jgi:hypothetical protein